MPTDFVLTLGDGTIIRDPGPVCIMRKARLLVGRVGPDRHDDYLILERHATDIPHDSPCYMQARPHREPRYEGMFLVEVRDGGARRHYVGHVEEEQPLCGLFGSYLREDEEWRKLIIWRDISYHFPDLQPYLPPEESAAWYFPDGEWLRGLEEKQRRDEEFWRHFDGS